MSGKVAYGTITDGLDRYYDAQNTTSYPGSGSTWFNFALGNDATLINSPRFDSSSVYGGIVFTSGSNQSFTIPYYQLTTEPFAVDIWYTTATSSLETHATVLSSGNRLVNAFSVTTGAAGWGIGAYANNFVYHLKYDDGTGPGSQQILQSYNTGSIYNIFLHRNTTTQRTQVYINGSRKADVSALNTKSFGGLNLTTLVQQSWTFGPAYASGTYHYIKLYRNKNFTEGEIVANYLALKDRFGI